MSLFFKKILISNVERTIFENKNMHKKENKNDPVSYYLDLIFFNFLKLVLFVFLHIVVQLLSCVWLFAISWAAAHQASLSFTISQSLLKLMSIESVMPSNHLILHLLLLLASTFPGIRDFSSVSALHIRWPKYWSFSFNTSPSNRYSGLLFFRVDWLDLLDVQGQTTNMEGAQRPPDPAGGDSWVKDLLSMILPTRARPFSTHMNSFYIQNWAHTVW